MKKYQFGKAHIPEWYYIYTLGGPRQFPNPTDHGASSAKPKKTQVMKGGWPVARRVPPADVPPEEAERLINSASKILVNTETADQKYTGKPRSKSSFQRYPLRPLEKPQAESSKPRPLTSKCTGDSNGHRVPSAKVKAHDDSHLDKAPRRPYLRRPQSSSRSAQQKTAKNSRPSSSPSQQSPAPSPTLDSQQGQRSPRQRRGSVVSVPPEHAEDEGVEEVTDGPWGEYQVNVKTGNSIGASTTAAVHLTIYGEKGRTPALHLATSQYNKVKFQRGKEDVFMLKTHHVGQVNKIVIGHDRPELSYAWNLESLSVHDMSDRQVYHFPCHRWLSGQDEDRRTYCTFLVKDTEKSKTSSSSHNKPESKASNARPKSGSPKKDSEAKKDTEASRRPRSEKSSGLTAPPRSQSAKRDRTQSKANEARTQGKAESDMQGKAKRSQQSDAHQDERGKDRRPQPVDQEYLAGYKAGVEAVEEVERQRKEEERRKSCQLLSGPSIHDACRRADLERVKELLQTFPEMKDSTDENGCTPLHIASSCGEIEILKRLTAAGGEDLDVETPTGYTPTHLAAMNGHISAVKILNAMGASMDCKTVDKMTPLHLAASAGHLECVKCLVANGVDLTIEDGFGRVPLDLAEQYEQEAVVEFLQHCQQDLANPSSTFALMHQLQNRGESEAQTAVKQNDKGTRHHEEAQTTRPMTSQQRKKAEEEETLQAKRELYQEQHRNMEEEGVSFLDLIRQEMEHEI